MDIYRVGVLIWLFIPFPICWLVRRWYFSQIRKYPFTTSGRLINVSYSDYGELDWNGVTNVTYAYSVSGIEYRGQGTLLGTNHKLGDELRVRYNSERPDQSRRDNLRDRIGFWAVLGTLTLAIDLGFFVFVISCGLLILFAGIRLLMGHQLQRRQWVTSPIFASILCIVLGLPLVALGFFGLIVGGFLGQNILWVLWNHLPFLQG